MASLMSVTLSSLLIWNRLKIECRMWFSDVEQTTRNPMTYCAAFFNLVHTTHPFKKRPTLPRHNFEGVSVFQLSNVIPFQGQEYQEYLFFYSEKRLLFLNALCFILDSTKYTATYLCSRKTSELIFNRTLDQKLKEEAYFFCWIMSHSTSNCCP